MRMIEGPVCPDNGLRASFHTLGCRLNQAETASISATFANRGYHVVDYGADTDVCVINTCSVTEGAEAKCRQAVRTVLRRSPNAYVVVTGCYAQVGKEALRGIDGLDLIVGTAHKMQVVDLIDTPHKEPNTARRPHHENRPRRFQPGRHRPLQRPHAGQPENPGRLQLRLRLLHHPLQPRRRPQPHVPGYPQGGARPG